MNPLNVSVNPARQTVKPGHECYEWHLANGITVRANHYRDDWDVTWVVPGRPLGQARFMSDHVTAALIEALAVQEVPR